MAAVLPLFPQMEGSMNVKTDQYSATQHGYWHSTRPSGTSGINMRARKIALGSLPHMQCILAGTYTLLNTCIILKILVVDLIDCGRLVSSGVVNYMHPL